VKKYELDATTLSQYDRLTEDERIAWLNPAPGSYHFFHVERMGVATWRIRDSASGHFYVCDHADAATLLLRLSCRKPDAERLARQAPLRELLRKVVTDEEIDDLFKDFPG
jgi:hypothetical protein